MVNMLTPPPSLAGSGWELLYWLVLGILFLGLVVSGVALAYVFAVQIVRSAISAGAAVASGIRALLNRPGRRRLTESGAV